jgi:tetratricopeptide (TPR) repeat protein
MIKQFAALIGIRFTLLICVSSAALCAASCASGGGAVSGASTLDQAITQTAAQISEKVPKGVRVAIINVDSASANLSEYIMDELTAALFKVNVAVADRRNLAFVQKELKLQTSGDVSEKSAKSIGQFLAADSIITGEFIPAGGKYRFRVTMVQVESAAVESLTSLDVIDNTALRDLIASLQSYRTASRAGGTPKDNRTAPVATAGDFLDSGLQWASEGDFAAAIGEYDEAIRLNPNLAAAYHNRADAYDEIEYYDKAIADYTRAIKIEPDNANIYIGRGFSYHHKGDYDKAIADYTRAIKIEPDIAYAYYSRALAYHYKDDYDRAIADYTRVIKIEPDNSAAYYDRGLAYDSKGDYRRAAADYTQTIKLDPDNDDARECLRALK